MSWMNCCFSTEIIGGGAGGGTLGSSSGGSPGGGAGNSPRYGSGPDGGLGLFCGVSLQGALTSEVSVDGAQTPVVVAEVEVDVTGAEVAVEVEVDVSGTGVAVEVVVLGTFGTCQSPHSSSLSTSSTTVSALGFGVGTFGFGTGAFVFGTSLERTVVVLHGGAGASSSSGERSGMPSW